MIRFCKGILNELLTAARLTMHRQISISILILVMSIGAYAQPNEVQDILVTPVASFGQANTVHQSFTPTQDGRLVKFTVDLGGNTPAGNRTVNIYEGDGIAGNLLATFTHNLVGNTSVVSVTDLIELPTPIAVTTGNMYTWQIDNVNPRTLPNTSGNDYTGGSGFNTFNGTPFTNFDIGFSIILDIGTNVSITNLESVATTDPFTFDVTFYGTPTGLESTDFTATNGTVAGLNMVTTDTYELSISPSGDGTVTVNMAAGVALIDGLDNDAATADAEVDLPPFQNPDLILTTTRIVQSGSQLFLNNAGINSSVFFAPEGTTNFTTGTSVTQGTTILIQDDPGCVPMPEVMCGTDPMTGLPDPPGCVPMAEVICTSTNQPVIFAPSTSGEYKLFLTDGAGNVEAVSSTTLSVTNETAATTAAITIDDENIITGETAEVTIAFLGAVTGFANDDLTVPNGMLSDVSSLDGNITFTATYTPNTDVVAASNLITLDNTGITDGATAGTGTTDSEAFAIDTGVPKISSIQCTSGCNDVYDRFSSGQTISIDVNFDRDVTLTGTMDLELAFEFGNKIAVVTQQSGTQNFTANYVLNQSDLTTDLDYTSTSALSLTTASSLLGVSNGVAADLTLVAPGAVGSISENRDVYIDQLTPQIVNVVRQEPTNEFISSDQVTFRVQFTEALDAASFGTEDFILKGTATGSGVVGAPVMIDATNYDYTVTGLDNASGTIGLQYNGALTDPVTQNPLAITNYTEQLYTLVNAVPEFETIAPTSVLSQGDAYEYNLSVTSNLKGAGYQITALDLPDWLTLVAEDTISTIAGTGTSGNTGNGGPALDADFGPFLRDVEYDPNGNLYIIDRNNHTIRKVDASNNISLFAGAGSAGFSGDNGSATAATFNFPSSIAFDQSGNAYIADDLNFRIRKVDDMGVITTIAGTGSSGFSGDLGLATVAEITQPLGVVVGPDDNLYIAEALRIRKVDLSTGIISTVAGNGTGTFVENVAATSSGFSINAIAIDTLGSIYIASGSHAVRKIDGITDLTSTIAGTGTMGFSGDGGLATSALLNNPNAIAVDDEGTVFIAERENDRIRLIDQGGMIRTFAGNGNLAFSGDGEAATSAAILNPEGLTIDDNGRVVFSDAGNLRVRVIETNKAQLTGTAGQSAVGTHDITVTATNGDESVDQNFTLTVNNVNDAPSLSPQLNATTIATEGASFSYTTYASDIDGDIVDLSSTILPSWLSASLTTEVFTFTSSTGVTDLAYSDDFFYLSNQDDNAIYRIDNLGGSLTQIAGQSDNSAGFTDDDGTAAAFETPFAIDVDSNGDLYIIDQDNHALRKITDVEGMVTVSTVAGNGSAGDATGAASNSTATFDTPTNVLVAPNGDIYIADAGNGVIKKLSGGMITTLQDGGGSDFSFTLPYGLAIDNSGVLYVTDFGGHAVYSIDGTTRTLLAGTSGTLGSMDGDGSAALFDEPAGITTNENGSVLFVAESGNGSIRRLDIDGSSVTVSTPGSSLDTPVGMIQNPQTGALLIADLGFNSITENYPAIAVSGTPINDNTGLNTVEFTLNDGTTDFTEEVNFFVTNTNDAPQFTSTVPVSNTEDSEFSYTIEAEDIDGDALGFEVTTLPDWMTLETTEPLVSTVAGNGTDAFAGDDGAATDASIGTPDAIAVDRAGNIFIAHENYIRKVDTEGNISTIVGDGTAANTGDGEAGTDAQITGINDMHIGPAGNLFISVSGAIRKLDVAGMITTISGTTGNTGSTGTGDGGSAISATFNQNSGIFVDQDGNVFIADQSDNVVRKISIDDGIISTVATGVTFPFDIVVDGDGNIYAVNDGSTGLLKIDENDVKTDLTSNSAIHFSTQDIAIDNLGNIYGISSFSSANQVKVYNIDAAEVSIIANDDDLQGFSGDGGVGSEATFNTLSALAVGPNGDLYLADQNNSRIRKLTLQDPILTGTPTQDEIGEHEVVLELTDGQETDEQTFTLTVNNLPEILHITSTNGNYLEGDEIDIVVTFDGDITSGGTGDSPSIELETGDTDQVINQSSNSGSTITFSYTVQAEDMSSDLAYNSTEIAIGEYTIQSPEGVDALLVLPSSGAAGSLSDNQDIVVDTEDPTLTEVTIGSDNASPTLSKEGDVITLAITTSESLESAPNVTIAGNTANVSTLTTSTFEATYTMSGDDSEGLIDFTVNFADETGNAGAEVTTTSDDSEVTYDRTAPEVEITSSSSIYNTAFEVTFIFTEEVTDFTIDDIVFSVDEGDVVSDAVSDFSGDGTVFTATITPTFESAYEVAVGANVAQDATGNPNTEAPLFIIEFDTTSPTATLSSTSASVNAPFTVTIDVNTGSVNDFNIDDLVVANGTTSDFAGDEDDGFTVTITPVEEGEVTIDIAADAFTDNAGNGNLAADQIAVTYDITAPTVTLISEVTDVNSSFDVTITFSEVVTGFATSDLTIVNGVAGDVFGSGTNYTSTITPNTEGEVTVNAVTGIVTDIAGNASTAAELSVNYDVTAPTVTLSSNIIDVNSPFDIAITFSESVEGFEATDLTIVNGTSGDISGSGTTYTATITPADEGEVTINLSSNLVQDASGNGNTVAAELSINYDVTSPDVMITSAANSRINGSFEVTVTFSESVEGFEATDLTIVNGTSGDISGSGTTYTTTITPVEEGELTINIAGGLVLDAAENGNTAAAEFSIIFDVTEPVPTISTSASELTNAPFDITVTFDEEVTGFEETDLTLENASSSNFSGSGTTYTMTITPTEDGTVSIGIPEHVATDEAGNENEESNALSITYDATSPTVVLSSESASVTGAFDISITFSESVSGLELADLTVENGSAGDFSGAGTTYTATITPASGGTVSISIAASVVQDEAGNSSTASNTLSVEFDGEEDTTAPTVTLSTASTSVSGAFDVGIEFSESVTGFEVGDLTITNGSASDFQGSGSSYLVTITPEEAGTIILNVVEGAAEDGAGNANVASNTLSVTFDGTPDTTAPTVSLSTANTSVSGVFDVSIAFSESVTGLELSDISVINGTAAGLTGSGSNYAVTVSPASVGTVTVSIDNSAVQDAAGNTNIASNSLSVEFDGTADTTAPTVTISTISTEVTGAFEIELIFNEEVTGFEVSDIIIDNGSVSEFDGTGSSYTATVDPSTTGVVTITIEEGVAQDAAGNGNEAATISIEATLEAVTLTVGLNSNEIKIYPNPTTEFIHIDTLLPIESYSVFDMNGRVVLEGDKKLNLINVARLKSGIYLFKANSKEGSLTKTFIKK